MGGAASMRVAVSDHLSTTAWLIDGFVAGPAGKGERERVERLAAGRRTDRLRDAGNRGGIDAAAEENANAPSVADAAPDGASEDLAEVLGVLAGARVFHARLGIEVPVSPHRRTARA